MFSPKENVASRTVEIIAVRGAVQIENDTPKEIAEGTLLVFNNILEKNKLHRRDLISLFFTITPDLKSELPPLALFI
jgi:chorismate mutase